MLDLGLASPVAINRDERVVVNVFFGLIKSTGLGIIWSDKLRKRGSEKKAPTMWQADPFFLLNAKKSGFFAVIMSTISRRCSI